MPWITLTPKHITDSLRGPEVTALSTFMLSPGQDDPLPGIVTQTVNKVQGYVATRYVIGQPGTIPEQLEASAVAIGRWLLIGTIPGARPLATDVRKQQYEDAIAELKDVANGKFKLSIADDPADSQPRPQAGGSWGSAKKF